MWVTSKSSTTTSCLVLNVQVQRLQLTIAQQQEQHLATIRKMKLEQNQVLLKHHELQHILQQQQ